MHQANRILTIVTVAVIIVSTLTMIDHFRPRRSALERVLDRGELVVATRLGPATVQKDGGTLKGFEYELLSDFADQLGVPLRIIIRPDLDAVAHSFSIREADLAALGTTQSELQSRLMRPGPPYMDVRPQLVYRAGNHRPRTVDDVTLDALAVSGTLDAGEFILTSAEAGKAQDAGRHGSGYEDVFADLRNANIDYVIANSHEVDLARRFHPGIKVAFDLGEPESLVWAFPRTGDESLLIEASEFFDRLRDGGELQRIVASHFGHTGEMNAGDSVTFSRMTRTRLPRLRWLFKKVARETGWDWRLLAAVSYQESHWKISARSPTGVRGLMMLTRDTAAEMGIEDRRDPEASLRGGALYLKKMRRRIPKRIAEPDRTWLALAAYNVGFGHLEDARKLTRHQGGNPDRWDDVRTRLPLLSRPEYYKYMRYGYARGYEPVRYVQNIRNYVDILRWMTENERRQIMAAKARTGPVTEFGVFEEARLFTLDD